MAYALLFEAQPKGKKKPSRRDEMKFITTIISRANNHVFQLSLRDKYLIVGMLLFPYLENMGYGHPIAPR